MGPTAPLGVELHEELGAALLLVPFADHRRAAAQAVEHYEITRYGTLKTWAEELGLQDAVGLLDATLQEEKETDEALTQLAETAVNRHAEAA